MTFDPERDGWSLRDAIMRTSNPMLLASIAQKRLELGQQPWWWVPELAPEPLLKRRIEYHIDPKQDYELTEKAFETAFRTKLVTAELVCWAQPATTDAGYRKLNASAWWALVVDDWWGGTLIEGTRDAHRDFVPVADGARYYGARIEKPGLRLTEPSKGGSPGKSYRRQCIDATKDFFDLEGGEGEEDAEEKAIAFINYWTSQNTEEGGPSSPNTVKTWARTALKECRKAKSSITCC